jgi:arylsulfatase A-like enzyme
VPLIIICDGIIPKNKIIDKQVQLIDVVPSILEALEITKPEAMGGVGLLPLVLEKDKELMPYAFSEEAVIGVDKQSIRTNEWKLICGPHFHKNRWELYNLKNDPRELNNLIEIEKEKFIFLKEKLDNWKKQAKVIPKKPLSLTEEDKERLRSLGYLH